MSKCVTFLAQGINVTAKKRSDALKYLAQDARSFRKAWNYKIEEIKESDAPSMTSPTQINIDVDVEDAPGRRERTWTGFARFHVVVGTTNNEVAATQALALLRG